VWRAFSWRSAKGFKIVSIVEYDGAVYNPKGLDIAALAQHRKETGTINGFSGGEELDKDQALFLECDVLLPAATENVITSLNAEKLRCKILCEGANGLCPPEMPKCLR
jgi:glutamate dehydrogenase (NAD(P)+)